MYSFNNDYSEGAHPRILDAIVRANLERPHSPCHPAYPL